MVTFVEPQKFLYNTVVYFGSTASHIILYYSANVQIM